MKDSHPVDIKYDWITFDEAIGFFKAPFVKYLLKAKTKFIKEYNKISNRRAIIRPPPF